MLKHSSKVFRSYRFVPQVRKMTTSPFHIKEHISRAQHSRSRYAGAAPGQENKLKLCVKQYIPKSNPNPKEGDVTIIGAVADAYPKEILEPMWEVLLRGSDVFDQSVPGRDAASYCWYRT